MKRYKFTIIILAIICLHTNLFADIAPSPIKAKSISPKDQTSIRMVSEKVIIDLYNDSSVVTCFFNMKNLGEQENLQIGFPDMSFHYFRNKSKVDEANRFKVKENGKSVQFDFSGSLRYDKEYRKKVESYQIKEEWYLWDSEFQKGESKAIEVQYSLPFGMLYKSNKRFFTYLVSTGANWKGTIGKAEIIVNLKGIEMDSIISQQPSNCEISNNQLTWTFLDFEPTTNDDIKVFYNSNKILYKGKKTIPPLFVVNEVVAKDFGLDKILPIDIASMEIVKTSDKNTEYKEYKEYKEPYSGVVKIYTKDYVLAKLERIIKYKTKGKIILPEYDKLKENYCLFVNENENDFEKVIGIDEKSILKLKIINSEGKKTKIIIQLK
jgi:hypothetical protein